MVLSAANFLKAIFRQIPLGPDNALVMLRSAGKGPLNEYQRCHSIADAVEYIESNRRTHNLYFSICPMRPCAKRGGAADATYLPCVTLDIDCADGGTHGDKPLPKKADADAWLRSGALQMPSITVDTGGGLHAYWLFENPIKLDCDENRALAESLTVGVYAELAKWYQSKGWKVDRLDSLAQVLRMPNTHNRKTNEPKLVSVIWPEEAV